MSWMLCPRCSSAAGGPRVRMCSGEGSPGSGFPQPQEAQELQRCFLAALPIGSAIHMGDKSLYRKSRTDRVTLGETLLREKGGTQTPAREDTWLRDCLICAGCTCTAAETM